jgi:hypothetical protein
VEEDRGARDHDEPKHMERILCSPTSARAHRVKRKSSPPSPRARFWFADTLFTHPRCTTYRAQESWLARGLASRSIAVSVSLWAVRSEVADGTLGVQN